MLQNIIISVATTILGVLIALWIDKTRLPSITIVAEERANNDSTRAAETYNAGQRWKFFRVLVINEKMPFCFKWLVRQTAENCRAVVTINGINNATCISYKGRWASTPELPYDQNALIKLFEPDPVTIMSGREELLDIITKSESDKEAYGWNNEAYFHQWRTPHYKLNCGSYKVTVTVNTQNGVSATKELCLVVGDTIENTHLSKNS